MCVIIDPGTLPIVFKKTDERHEAFQPVLQWVYGDAAKGFVIYGGTKYAAELSELTSVLGILAEIARRGRTVRIPSDAVDSLAAELKRDFPVAAFNDEHIVALVILSRCRVVCSVDKASMCYIKSADIYKKYKGVSRPKIFSGQPQHHKLCCDSHIVAMCKQQASLFLGMSSVPKTS